MVAVASAATFRIVNAVDGDGGDENDDMNWLLLLTLMSVSLPLPVAAVRLRSAHVGWSALVQWPATCFARSSS